MLYPVQRYISLRYFTYYFLSREAFLIPEIIFDPTLVLSPYVFLLGILFRISAFKSLSYDSPVLDCPKKLYRLRVLYSLGEQELKLKDDSIEQHMFC